MSDITQIKRTLESKAREVAEYLLPAGVLSHREWEVGSLAGEPGKSLKICVSGAKAGTWCDFAEGGEGGDLIDLWQAIKGLDLPQALDDIRGWLGIEEPSFAGREVKSYRRPTKPKCVVPSSAVKQYLTEKRRISAAAIAAYKIGEQGRTMVFPYLLDSELIFVKYRSIDDKKDTRVEAECEPILFGWQVIQPNAREVTICEGELDAPTLWDYGIPALSVPFGGGAGAKQRWIESEFDRLSRFETIYLAMDMDKAGDEAVTEIVNRLGRHRCRRVELPKKDANDCAQSGVTAEQIKACFAAAKTCDPDQLKRAGEFTDAVITLFWPPVGEEPGYRLPWATIGNRLHFRPGELTVWTGPSGSGKSQALSHASVAMGDQGARVCIASLEMRAPQFLRRMVKQAGNVDRPTEPFIREIMGWFNDWLWCFDLVGKCDIPAMLEVFEYARARYGCDTFIIDSLMRLGIGSEDYEGQEQAIYALINWTVEKGVHTHLVAHSRKADKQSGAKAPETEDIKGASEIGSNAMNIIGIWRDRKLEDKIKLLRDKIDAGQETARLELQDIIDTPPVILNVAKQRNGDWEGKCGLWFSQESYQYRSSKDQRDGMKYVTRLAPRNEESAA